MHVGVWVISKARDGLLSTAFQYQDLVEEKELPKELLKEKIIDHKDLIYFRSNRTQKLCLLNKCWCHFVEQISKIVLYFVSIKVEILAIFLFFRSSSLLNLLKPTFSPPAVCSLLSLATDHCQVSTLHSEHNQERAMRTTCWVWHLWH